MFILSQKSTIEFENIKLFLCPQNQNSNKAKKSKK
jgi:hypothetical protein